MRLRLVAILVLLLLSACDGSSGLDPNIQEGQAQAQVAIAQGSKNATATAQALVGVNAARTQAAMNQAIGATAQVQSNEATARVAQVTYAFQDSQATAVAMANQATQAAVYALVIQAPITATAMTRELNAKSTQQADELIRLQNKIQHEKDMDQMTRIAVASLWVILNLFALLVAGLGIYFVIWSIGWVKHRRRQELAVSSTWENRGDHSIVTVTVDDKGKVQHIVTPPIFWKPEPQSGRMQIEASGLPNLPAAKMTPLPENVLQQKGSDLVELEDPQDVALYEYLELAIAVCGEDSHELPGWREISRYMQESLNTREGYGASKWDEVMREVDSRWGTVRGSKNKRFLNNRTLGGVRDRLLEYSRPPTPTKLAQVAMSAAGND